MSTNNARVWKGREGSISYLALAIRRRFKVKMAEIPPPVRMEEIPAESHYCQMSCQERQRKSTFAGA
jgi:hypothetical protein